MSLDPYDLEYGDEVTFGGKISRKIDSIIKGKVRFDDGYYLEHDDPLWELANLVSENLPKALNVAVLNESGLYKLDDDESYTPSTLLNFLREDVANLEAAGVGKEKNE